MLSTIASDLLGIRYPICQAGMANYTSPELVAAVSQAGGLGCHGSLSRTPDELRQLLRTTRALLHGEPFGVNIVVARSDEATFQVCLAERVPVFAFSWGIPTAWVAQAQAQGSKVIIQVTTVDEVPSALAVNADLLIAQGTEGGGHSGYIPLAELLPAVVAVAGDTPVLAAGGIIDGQGLAAALALGAAGGWLGTRFLATPEAPISPAWKAAIVAAKPGTTIHTATFDILWGQPWPGAQVRAIRNQFTDTWDGREAALRTNLATVQSAVWAAERDDNPALFALMAGTGAGQIAAIIPASTVVDTIAQQTAATIQRLAHYTTAVHKMR